MKRLIITGSNGVGKSHLTTRLAALRPDVPMVSYDALRLTENWVKKDPADISNAVARLVEQEAWLLEGGPSLLDHALSRCQGVIWLDPPELTRLVRLGLRPLRNFGRSRPELPDGNIDWPVQQYVFALKSLRKGPEFRASIAAKLQKQPPPHVWRCRSQADIEAAIKAVSNLAPKQA